MASSYDDTVEPGPDHRGGRAPVMDAIDGLMGAVRRHLGLSVAFVAEVEEGRRYVRWVSAEGPSGLVVDGEGEPVEETYCGDVLGTGGGLLLPDASRHPRLAALPVTRRLGIGSYVGAPIHRRDGSVFGALCLIGHRPHPELDRRDLRLVQLFAELVGHCLDDDLPAGGVEPVGRLAVEQVIDGGGPRMVFQPIIDLTSRRAVGIEALARFDQEPVGRPPDVWFAEAARLGLGADLERAAVRAALARLGEVPPAAYVSVNVSPETLCGVSADELLGGADPARVVVEVTEHEAIVEPVTVADALGELRRRGVRVAIDDVGTGYAALVQVVELEPDILKLDGGLIHRVDRDPSRQAMVGSAVRYAEATGTVLVAEGVETERELVALRQLGVAAAQGYHLARPAPLDDLDLGNGRDGPPPGSVGG